MSDDVDARTIAVSALLQLRRRVDDHFDAAVHRTPAAFACRVGCSSCCHVQIGVTGIEADRVRAALVALGHADPALRDRVRAQGRDPRRSSCALLVDDRCAVYDERPLICRSHGLPVRATLDDGSRTDSVCPLNFTEHAPPAASVLALDAVNAPLSVMAHMWDGRGDRIGLAGLAAEPG